MDRYQYRKRSSMRGFPAILYKTKLVSLLSFRANNDERIEEFYLGTNVEGIGDFDNICFRAKIKGFDKPLALFIHTTHREQSQVFNVNNIVLDDYFKSYFKVRKAFGAKVNNKLFEGTFDETECRFIFYTNEKDDGNHIPCDDALSRHLNKLISTGEGCSQTLNKQKYKDDLLLNYLRGEATSLARRMWRVIEKKVCDNEIFNDEYISQYHVMLVQNVFDVSDIQPEGHRIACFRQDIFQWDKELFHKTFKDALIQKILENPRFEKYDVEDVLKRFLSTDPPQAQLLSQLLGRVVTYRHGFPFFFKGAVRTLHRHKFEVDEEILREATELAVKDCISSLKFNVPAAFGNKDLTISGDEDNIERRLDFLVSTLVQLTDKSKPNNIITIDESVQPEFVKLNGGIASAVGNLLVLDDTTKLLKVTDEFEPLGPLAKRFLTKLKSQIHELHDYRFDFRIQHFPKLSSSRSKYENELVDFLDKFVVFTNQANEIGVEEILKQEIQHIHFTHIRSEAIYLKYHHDIQKWWMTPREARLLTKDSDIYKNAVESVCQPLVSIVNTISAIKHKHYTFTKAAVDSLKLDEQPSDTAILTSNIALTLPKIKQYWKDKEIQPIVLDIAVTMALNSADRDTLFAEIKSTSNATPVILLNMIIFYFARYKQEITNAIKDKHTIIIITDDTHRTILHKHFPHIKNIVHDDNKLTDLSEESQDTILKETNVIFQGALVSLDQLLDKESIKYVTGNVLNQIMHRNDNVIGTSLSESAHDTQTFVTRPLSVREPQSNTNVDVSKKHYRNRGVQDLNETKDLIHMPMSLNTLEEHVTVIVGDPGMGKSRLLTELSLATKRVDRTRWIVRVNLLEHARKLNEWKQSETVIHTVEILSFLSRIAVSMETKLMNDVDITLEESNSIVTLRYSSADEWTVFEIHMFLHYYFTKKLSFLFDGYDEICPHYASQTLALIKQIENHHKNHRIWITSRTYDDIVHSLKLNFGSMYELEPWRNYYIQNYSIYPTNDHYYFNNMWNEKRILSGLNDVQLENVYKLIKYMSRTYRLDKVTGVDDVHLPNTQGIPFSTIYFWFMLYLKSVLSSPPEDVLASLNKMCDRYRELSRTDELVTTPLHIHLVTEYLYDKIRDTSDKADKWHADTNIINVYLSFLETKLKIRFEEKNEIDIYKPDNIIIYNKEYADCNANHKKLAAYAVFHPYRNQLFSSREQEEITKLLEMVKAGEEKTGIICNVVDNIPIFLHSTFAEYFAIEFICDSLRGCTRDAQRPVWDLILNVMLLNCNEDVLTTFDDKIRIDTELMKLIKEEHGQTIFELLMEQSKNVEMKWSLCEAIRKELHETSALLLTIYRSHLTSTSVVDLREKFINTVHDTEIIMIAHKMKSKTIIAGIIEVVKKINQSKLVCLFENVGLQVIGDEINTDELVEKFNAHMSVVED